MPISTETSLLSRIRTCPVCNKQFELPPGWHRITCGRSCGVTLGHRRSGKRKKAKVDPKKLAVAVKQWHRARRENKYPKLAERAWLHDQYVVQELSQQEIAELVGCQTRSPVRTALLFHGIPIRSSDTGRTERSRMKCSGQNNWNWKGGKYNGEVCGFSESSHIRIKLRRALIAARGLSCEWCGKQTRGGHQIHVHHVKTYRYSKLHTRGNIALLCTACHSAADKLVRRLALEYYASHGWPGLMDAVTTLKLSRSTNT